MVIITGRLRINMCLDFNVSAVIGDAAVFQTKRCWARNVWQRLSERLALLWLPRSWVTSIHILSGATSRYLSICRALLVSISRAHAKSVFKSSRWIERAGRDGGSQQHDAARARRHLGPVARRHDVDVAEIGRAVAVGVFSETDARQQRNRTASFVLLQFRTRSPYSTFLLVCQHTSK